MNELEDENRKLRLELHTLRFKESQEQRFIWWVLNVYGKHIQELLGMLEKTTRPFTPFGMSAEIRYIKEGTEHIYDGTYLDVEISVDVKNTNPDYYKLKELSDRFYLLLVDNPETKIMADKIMCDIYGKEEK